ASNSQYSATDDTKNNTPKSVWYWIVITSFRGEICIKPGALEKLCFPNGIAHDSTYFFSVASE
ncbi:TPA: hypothetical protein ACG1VA_004307, partial [Escherichia coli]